MTTAGAADAPIRDEIFVDREDYTRRFKELLNPEGRGYRLRSSRNRSQPQCAGLQSAGELVPDVGRSPQALLVPWLLPLLAASCAGDSSTETSEEPVAGEYAAEEETAKIVGVAEGASDVGAGDYHPLTSGTVAFFSPDEEAQLWSDLSFEPEEYRLTTVGGGIDAGGLSQGQLAPISEGRFKADVEDGAYLVCLIAGDGPWSLRGCGRMSVEGPADWVLSHDEGGVFVYEATAQ